MNPEPEINILYKTSGWLAVDKPEGISVHNDPGHDLITLVKQKISSDPDLKRQVEFDPTLGIQPIHRLDKETSGVILLACSQNSLSDLSSAFAENQVKKEYATLVHGNVRCETDPGVWDMPLTKSAAGRQNPAGKGRKVDCRTEFKVIDKSEHYTRLSLNLVTGRKHQIRRHAKLAGHPVVGDQRYGSKRAILFLKEQKGFNRLALHCHALTLKHPGSEQTLTIVSKHTLGQINQLLENDR
jgi:RluA family pseudouridine synthase